MVREKSKEEKKKAQERLVAVIKAIGFTEQQFMRMIGLSPSYARNFTGNMNPKNVRLCEIVFPYINIDYLNEGVGEMFHYEPTKEDKEKSMDQSKSIMLDITNSKSNFVNSMNSSGGNMNISGDSQQVESLKQQVALLKQQIQGLEHERDYLRQQVQTLIDVIANKK